MRVETGEIGITSAVVLRLPPFDINGEVGAPAASGFDDEFPSRGSAAKWDRKEDESEATGASKRPRQVRIHYTFRVVALCIRRKCFVENTYIPVTCVWPGITSLPLQTLGVKAHGYIALSRIFVRQKVTPVFRFPGRMGSG